jgi:hypothetical protein
MFMLRLMSTVLRPVGPEPAQTYWVRRLAVIGVAIAVLAAIGALIANGTTSGSAVQASPPPPTLVATETPTPSAQPTASATPTASASVTAARATVATPTTAAPITAAPTMTSTPPPAPCVPSTLRATLTGNQQLKRKTRTTFRVSLINGSGRACVASVSRDNFELKIYSGSDRIWSTKDCATAVKPLTRKLDPEQAVEWSHSWNGRRSRTGCQSRPEIPRPGTYWATAQLAGAEPVQLRMILTG